MRRAIEDAAAFREAVRPLLGTWRGDGQGGFPTIAAFTYVETLRLDMREGEDTLRYEQRTWRRTTAGQEPSHWEVGLCWIDGHGQLLLSSAQNGRTEAMLGHAAVDDDELILELETVACGLDERPTAATRRLRLSGTSIVYEMRMATTRVPELTLHLRCRLERSR